MNKNQLQALILTLFVLLIFSLYSCNNDFNINDEWENITVVYGILDPNEPVNYIRVNKAFLGVGDLYQMAAVSDSIQYLPVLDVKLERYDNGVLRQTIQLADTVIPKEQNNPYGQPGIFATDNNILYYTRQVISPGYKYKLRINSYLLPKEVWSETELMNPADFKILKPTSTMPPKIAFEDYNRNFDFEWESVANGRIYQVVVRFHFSETTTSGTTLKYTDWILTPEYSLSLSGGEKMLKSVKVIDFYQMLVNQIPEAHGEVRRPLSVDFMFFIAHEELNIYIQVTKPSTNIVQDRPSYTNIKNGIGIFTCRINKEIPNRILTFRTIDSIANGKYTRKLGFTNL